MTRQNKTMQSAASFMNPAGVGTDINGNVFTFDEGSQRLRRMSIADGSVITGAAALPHDPASRCAHDALAHR